ncbi:hypothetical protein PFISCL1PPCAC_16402 [Pristionchus fissidentatus]|uniref:Uncharacterized protein n=1 Tax=Pristionchus fissidentatus TaxID=1538716 RepID=A0AAV5W363_9BILA|nr:hypothetical protein PFISCL1PPCAC_16402 [Pristionchus fissidentatus]
MTSKSFDPYEWYSFYFARMSREEAAKVLQESSIEVGTFLLRDSSREGEYSLSVRESLNTNDPKAVRHYLIQQAVDDELNKCIKIGSQCFEDIPSMLNYYKMRLLENCSLTQPYRNMQVTKMMGKWKFVGETDADLSFAQGEELEVMGEIEPGWLRARNVIGRVGRVPEEYLGVPEYEPAHKAVPLREMAERCDVDLSQMDPWQKGVQKRSFPCWARASFTYPANVFDKEKVTVKKRDIIFVLEVQANGWARGRVYGEGVAPRENGEQEEKGDEEVVPEGYADPDKYFVRKDCSHIGLFPSSLLDYCKEEEGMPMREKSRYGEWKEVLGSSDDERDYEDTERSQLRSR